MIICFKSESKIEAITDLKKKYSDTKTIKTKLCTRNISSNKANIKVLEKKNVLDNQSLEKRIRKRPFCWQCADSVTERSWEKVKILAPEKPKRSKSWVSRRTAIKLLTVKEKTAGVKFPMPCPKKKRLSDRQFSEIKSVQQEDDMFQKTRPKWNGMLLRKSSRALVNSDSSETDDPNQQTGPRSPTLWGCFGNSYLQASTPKELKESSPIPKLLINEQEAVILKRRASDRTTRRQKARESLQFPMWKKEIFCQDVPPSCQNQGTSDLTPFDELASVVKEATAVKEGEAFSDLDLSAVESYFSDN